MAHPLDLAPFQAPEPAIPAVRTRPQAISVGVLVGLEHGPQAGGHVKCWERFAEAATLIPSELDLTVYFLGEREGEIGLSGNVRYRLLPPAFGTDRIPALRQGAGNTDLARHHRRLAGLLHQHQVLHATDVFTFAWTAQRVARRNGLAFSTSIHTDVVEFTRVYSRDILARIFGTGWLGRQIVGGWHADDRLADMMQRRLDRLLGASDHVMVSRPRDRQRAERLIGARRVSRLRRGVDIERFNPRHRDQDRLRKQFGIPPDRPVVLFVGRIDASKRALQVAECARLLIDAGHPVHTLMVGEGADMEPIRRLLGPTATLPGALPQEALAWIYASADLFVFPSESEIFPNVVLEAKASGLPVLVSIRDGGAQIVAESGVDGLVIDGRTSADWARAAAPLVADPIKRAEVAYAARKAIDERWPSWLDVLRQDLLEPWRTLVGNARERPG